MSEDAMRIMDPEVQRFFGEIQILLASCLPANTYTEEKGWQIARKAPDIETMLRHMRSVNLKVEHYFSLSYQPPDNAANGLILFAKKGVTTVGVNGAVDNDENSAWLSFGKDGTLSFRDTKIQFRQGPRSNISMTSMTTNSSTCESVSPLQLSLVKNLVETICYHLKHRP